MPAGRTPPLPPPAPDRSDSDSRGSRPTPHELGPGSSGFARVTATGAGVVFGQRRTESSFAPRKYVLSRSERRHLFPKRPQGRRFLRKRLPTPSAGSTNRIRQRPSQGILQKPAGGQIRLLERRFRKSPGPIWTKGGIKESSNIGATSAANNHLEWKSATALMAEECLPKRVGARSVLFQQSSSSASNQILCWRPVLRWHGRKCCCKKLLAGVKLVHC
jgi:hypothetical protein